ncbi:hypothetical protein GGI12_005159 [Dipsacomyces acuminosporus]|nr:hypothetical protein GGI12_005159 [Dipsacomyces acuminosporus]
MLLKNSIVLLVATAIVAVSAAPAPVPAKGSRASRPSSGTGSNRDIGRKIDTGMRRTEQAIGIGERLHDIWRQVRPKQEPQQGQPGDLQRRTTPGPVSDKSKVGPSAPRPRRKFTLPKLTPKFPSLPFPGRPGPGTIVCVTSPCPGS